MTEYPAKRSLNLHPSHPGEVLREDVFPAINLSKTEIANRLSISRQHLYDILSGKKPVSPTIAAKLGKFLGNGPGLWLRMQASYDTWHAEREIDVFDVKKFEPAE